MTEHSDDPLSDTYIPKQLPFRDKQINALMEGALAKGVKNFYCEGKTSTGKTVTVKKLIQDLDGAKHLTVYVYCRRMLKRAFKSSVEHAVGKISTRQSPIDELFKRAKQDRIHVIFDDFQNIAHYKIVSPFLESLYTIAQETGKELQVISIGTMRYPDFLSSICAHEREDVSSRFKFKLIFFGAYEASEIQKIFSQRLELCGIEYKEDAIRWLGGNIRSIGADIRRGLEVLREAREHLRKNSSNTINFHLMEKVWEKTEVDYWAESLSVLDPHSQLLVYAASKLAETGNEISTIDISELYRKLCLQNKIEPLYAQRINYLLKKLVSSGWLTTLYVESRGWQGKTAIFRYEMVPLTILKAFKKMV